MTTDLRARLRDGPPILMDGPTGTALEALGVDTRTPLWSARALFDGLDLIESVHQAYVDAGAELHSTVTFRTNPSAFAAAGRPSDEWTQAIEAAFRAARAATRHATQDIWIAGSLAPIGDCYDPGAVPPEAHARAEHERHAEALARCGADLLLVETMNTIREAYQATAAAKATGLPVITSWVVVPGGRLLSGESLADAVDTMLGQRPDAVGVNCSSLAAVHDAAPILADSGIPWGAYANGSAAHPRAGWTAGPDVDSARYARAASNWLDYGAAYIGSCCGTGPQHTRRLLKMMQERSGNDG